MMAYNRAIFQEKSSYLDLYRGESKITLSTLKELNLVYQMVTGTHMASINM